LSQRKLVPMLVAVLALAALAAGCGGGGSSSSGSTAVSTTTEGGSGEFTAKATFIKEADAICSEADARLTREITRYAERKGITISQEAGPSQGDEIEIFHAVILPNIGRQAEEIAALTPPPGDAGTIEEITDTLAEEVAAAEARKTTAADGGTFTGATEKAHAYGLKTCGS
jgi:hypothetical protein